MLSKKQKEFLEKIKELYGKDPLPSYEKIAKDLGFKHKNSVWQYFNKLKEHNYIKEVFGRFYINKEQFGVLYYEQGARAGNPNTVFDDIPPEKILLDDYLIKDSEKTFLIKIKGDSMIDALIGDGDIAIVEKYIHPKNWSIVLACIEGELTVKYYRKNKEKIWFEPANKDYSIINPKGEFEILGVITGIIRKI